jgi:hypothetical protein
MVVEVRLHGGAAAAAAAGLDGCCKLPVLHACCCWCCGKGQWSLEVQWQPCLLLLLL